MKSQAQQALIIASIGSAMADSMFDASGPMSGGWNNTKGSNPSGGKSKKVKAKAKAQKLARRKQRKRKN